MSENKNSKLIFLWTIKKLINKHEKSMKNSITKQILLVHFAFNTS